MIEDGAFNSGDVSEYLDGAKIFKGELPYTIINSDLEHVGLAHVDLDVYGPTLTTLTILWGRMEPNGMIVIDDYGDITTQGVRHAVDEFILLNHCWNLHLPSNQMLLRKK